MYRLRSLLLWINTTRLEENINEYIPVLFQTTDPQEDKEYDLTIAHYWAYPTHMLSNYQKESK